MEDQAAKDDATKKRIISHMNKDHHDSIICYLEHFAQLSTWAAYDGVMIDINLNEMSLVCGEKKYRIPLDPPMKSLSDARERLSEMDKDCRKALGRSEITIKEFVPPTGWYAPMFVIIAATFLGYSQRWWFQKGEIVERLLGSGFAKFSWTIQPWLIWGMVGLHAAEVIYFVPFHLTKHSIHMRSRLWWVWVSTIFIEGQFAMKRWRDLVARKVYEKEKQKH